MDNPSYTLFGLESGGCGHSTEDFARSGTNIGLYCHRRGRKRTYIRFTNEHDQGRHSPLEEKKTLSASYERLIKADEESS